jgi:hypothetical protein
MPITLTHLVPRGDSSSRFTIRQGSSARQWRRDWTTCPSERQPLSGRPGIFCASGYAASAASYAFPRRAKLQNWGPSISVSVSSLWISGAQIGGTLYFAFGGALLPAGTYWLNAHVVRPKSACRWYWNLRYPVSSRSAVYTTITTHSGGRSPALMPPVQPLVQHGEVVGRQVQQVQRLYPVERL